MTGFVRVWILLVAGLFWVNMAAGAELGDDGLHKQPWFYDSFLDMQEDLADAMSEGKDLVILFEQNGCPYCRELHQVNFAREEIVSFITANFVTVQLDLYGSRMVTDFDGEELEERDLAGKWGVNFTPSTVILVRGDAPPGDVGEAMALLLPGYLKPFHYLTSLEYVAGDEYRNLGFQRFLRAKIQKLAEKGLKPDVW